MENYFNYEMKDGTYMHLEFAIIRLQKRISESIVSSKSLLKSFMALRFKQW